MPFNKIKMATGSIFGIAALFTIGIGLAWFYFLFSTQLYTIWYYNMIGLGVIIIPFITIEKVLSFFIEIEDSDSPPYC